ncbi:MAG TPA: VTT domain-containing protein [Polyangiales bacterium]|nr:VTT domain-containing protein [Polyangiales bacterium]
MDSGCAEPSNTQTDASPIGKAALFAPLLPFVVLLAVWLSGGLSRFDSPEEVAEALRSLRGSPLGLGYVVLGYAVGTLFFMPITALIAGTLLAFGPLVGFFYAFIGVQLAATTTYYCGRILGGRALDHLRGPRVRKLRALLREHAVRASAAARALPLGNFTLLNWLIGGLKVPFRWFIVGNALGTIPGLLVLSLFADRLSSVLHDPQPEQIALLIGVGVGALLLIYLGQRFAKRFAQQ